MKKVPSLGDILNLSERGVFIAETRYTPGERGVSASGLQLGKGWL